MRLFKNWGSLSAIGPLYGEFREDRVNCLLTVQDMRQDDMALLRRVIETVRQYFSDPAKFDQAVREALEDKNDDV